MTSVRAESPLPARASSAAGVALILDEHPARVAAAASGLLRWTARRAMHPLLGRDLDAHAGAGELRQLAASPALVQPALDANAADAAARQAVAEENPPAAGRVARALAKGEAGGDDDGVDAGDGEELTQYLQTDGRLTARTFAAVAATNRDLASLLGGRQSLRDVPVPDRKRLRRDLYLVDQTLEKLAAANAFKTPIDADTLGDYHRQLEATSKFIPTWVKFATALALGFGTMVGWKRIVVTVGERIGKQHLTYAEGMSAELTAMLTIGAATRFGAPVSTTHVLSSGIAGTMAANHSGLQAATLRNILLAWVLTLPVCVLLGATLFAAGLLVVLSHLAAVITAVIVAAALGTAAWRMAGLARRRPAGRRPVRADAAPQGV